MSDVQMNGIVLLENSQIQSTLPNNNIMYFFMLVKMKSQAKVQVS